MNLGIRRPEKAKPGEVNYDFVDRFTLVHFAIGVAYAYFGFSFLLVVILGAFWELIEDILKAYIPQIFPHATSDTWKNILGDLTAVIVGWCFFNSLVFRGLL